MGLAVRNTRAQQRSLRRGIKALQARLVERERQLQAAMAAMADQLKALEPVLLADAEEDHDPREQLLQRLQEALPPEQTLEDWSAELYGPALDAALSANPGLLEQVAFTMVRCRDCATAEALLPQLRSGDPLAAEVTAGWVGPRRLHSLNTSLGEALSPLEPGAVAGPLAMGSWWVVLRLEQRNTATVTAELRQEMVAEMLEQDLTAVLDGRAPIHADALTTLLTR